MFCNTAGCVSPFLSGSTVPARPNCLQSLCAASLGPAVAFLKHASCALTPDCVTPAYLQSVSPPLCCSCCFSEAPNLLRALLNILLGFGKKRFARCQSTVNADFISSLLKSNSQPQIVIGWCLQLFLQPNTPCFWVQLERLTPGLAPSFHIQSTFTLRGFHARRRDMGSLVVGPGGWERICFMLLHLPGASSASASALMRRDQMLIFSSPLETRGGQHL